MKSSAKVDFGSGPNGVDYALNGLLEASVLRQEIDTAAIRIQLRDSRVTNRNSAGGADLGKLEVALQSGDAVAIFSRGMLAEFGMRKGAPAAAASTYRQVAAALQMPAGDAESTTLEEFDTTGKCVARYDQDHGAGTYLKRKIKYLSLLGQPLGSNGMPIGVLPDIERSEERIELSADRAIRGVDLHENVSIDQSGISVRSVVALELRLVKVEETAAAADEWMRGQFSVAPASEPDGRDVPVESLDGARTGGASFRGILAKIAEELQRAPKASVGPRRRNGRTESHRTTDPAVFDALVAVLRKDGGAIKEASRMVQAQSELSGILIDALSSASTPESEGLLLTLASPTGTDIEMRERALYALGRMPRPGERSIALFKELLAKDPFNAEGLFALGTYSWRFREARDLARADDLGRYLVAKLAAAEGPLAKTTCLRALENSGYADALVPVRRHLADSNAEIRGAALRALGAMRIPAVDDVLSTKLLSGASRDEQLLAIDVARRREPSEKLVAALAKLCAAPDPTLRYRAVEALSGWITKMPNLRPLLETISQRDAEPRIRGLARAAL